MAFRLYREETFQSLPAATVPEIQRVSLASLMLQLKQLGIQQPQDFDFMDRCFTPTPEHPTMPTLSTHKGISDSCSALLSSTVLRSLQSPSLGQHQDKHNACPPLMLHWYTPKTATGRVGSRSRNVARM